MLELYSIIRYRKKIYIYMNYILIFKIQIEFNKLDFEIGGKCLWFFSIEDNELIYMVLKQTFWSLLSP